MFTGAGIHSTTYNRISATMFNLWALSFLPLAMAWFYSLCVAVVHCSDAVALLITEVSPPEQDIASDTETDPDDEVAETASSVPQHTEEEWRLRVLEPTQTLAKRIIPSLSRGWGQVQAIAIVLCAVIGGGVSSLALSPVLWFFVDRELGEEPGFMQDHTKQITLCIRIVLYSAHA